MNVEKTARELAKEKAVAMAAGLRQLADQIEARGEDLPLPDRVYVYCDANVWKPDYSGQDTDATKRVVKKAIRAMGRGKKNKTFNDYEFKCEKDFGDYVRIVVKTTRSAVCRKVPTGNKIIHAATTYSTPERIEEEFEWVCDDPILAAPEPVTQA